MGVTMTDTDIYELIILATLAPFGMFLAWLLTFGGRW